MTDTITGELVAHRVVGADFWSIATIKTRDQGSVAATGKLLGAEIGDTVEVEGIWNDSKKYGRQFKVRDCIVLLPNTDNGVVAWLSGRLKNIGRSRAEEMLAHFGGAESLWDVIENAPARLVEVKGITSERVDEIVESYAKFRHDRDRIIRFKRWGMTDNQIAKVIAKWADESEAKMRENPYALADFVDGFGFIKADKIAQRMGVPRDSESRIRCGLRHTMKQAEGHGHCYMPSGKLVKMAADKVLRIDGKLVAKELAIMKKSGELVQHGKRTFTRHLDKHEAICAERIAALLAQRKKV